MSTKETNLQSLQLTSPEPDVARVNRKLIILLACALGAVLAGSLVWGLQPLKSIKGKKEETTDIPSAVTMPENFSELPGSYTEAKIREKDVPMVDTDVQESALGNITPTSGRTTTLQAGQEEKAQVQREKQEEAQALRSKLTVSLTEHTVSSAKPGNAAATSMSGNASALPEEKIPVDPDAVQNMQQAKRDFIKNNGDNTVYLTHTLQPPISEYQVNAGTLIPASLMTGINSDLPGQIVAQVRENVYDTVTGNILLIPQGARLIGQYDSLVSYGQNRILLIWDKLVMPDGNTITLDSMAGTDLAGYAGLKDGVDYHTMRLAGSVLISSLLSVGVTETQAGRTGVSQQFSQNVAEDINKAGQEIVRKNLNIQPTITIRPGYSLNVFVNKHMVLEPYVEISPSVHTGVHKVNQSTTQ